MIDANSLPENQLLEADLCIVGGGPAGLGIACALGGSGLRILLLESGGGKFRHPTQFLYRAELTGRPTQPVEFTKQRYLGGASNRWAGRCRPLDDFDFEIRSWLPNSGWPLKLRDLLPYYQQAAALLQIEDAWDDQSSPETDFFLNTDILPKVFQFSPVRSVAEAWLPEIRRDSNIKVLLQANVVHIQLAEDGNRVSHLDCATMWGKRFRVSARKYILAASALENTRLLLAARDVHPHGIGNQHDQLGRTFMDHPHVFIAHLESLPDAWQGSSLRVLDYNSELNGLGRVSALGLPADIHKREQLLNAGAFLVWRPMYKVLANYGTRLAEDLRTVQEALGHRAPPAGVLKLARLFARPFESLRLVKSGISARKKIISLGLSVETEPNQDSRVTLSTRRDHLGVPTLRVDWQTTQNDVDSFTRYRDVLLAGLAQAGISFERQAHEMDAFGWPVSMTGSKHHLGTTRMSSDPRHGVVDGQCRVHGIENLFVAGGSVFATSGMANPTLTILALALRLAEHVLREFRKA